MKTHLPLILGISVIVLFALVIATCLLWTPVKVTWYVSKLRSVSAGENAKGVDGLLSLGERGKKAFQDTLSCKSDEAEFIAGCWNSVNDNVPEWKNDSEAVSMISPLHYAVISDYVHAVRLFLAKGADVHAIDHRKQAPLHYAVRWERPGIMRLLLEGGADINVKDVDGSTPLHLASGMDGARTVKFLLRKDADINAVNNIGFTPLFMAAGNGRIDNVKLLVDAGAGVRVKGTNGETPLHRAGYNGRTAVIKYLISKGAAVNARCNNSYMPLYKAAGKGHLEAVKLLIDKGADVNATNYYDKTALWTAASNAHKSVVELLVKKGADMEMADKGGRTPLVEATHYHSSEQETAIWLIENGADINGVSNNGWTAAQEAAMHDCRDVLNLLIKKGAKLKGTAGGNTALYWAVDCTNYEIAELLIEKGLDVNAANSAAKTPLDIAIAQDKTRFADLLRKHGGKTGEELGVKPEIKKAGALSQEK
ncbi:MAG: hypothetical protein E3J72_09445 [Planctomycetota bacterium]|nr:MAG: hypothetical protein E3J72_09445 [Planctomycetota bacterium]